MRKRHVWPLWKEIALSRGTELAQWHIVVVRVPSCILCLNSGHEEDVKCLYIDGRLTTVIACRTEIGHTLAAALDASVTWPVGASLYRLSYTTDGSTRVELSSTASANRRLMYAHLLIWVVSGVVGCKYFDSVHRPKHYQLLACLASSALFAKRSCADHRGKLFGTCTAPGVCCMQWWANHNHDFNRFSYSICGINIRFEPVRFDLRFDSEISWFDSKKV